MQSFTIRDATRNEEDYLLLQLLIKPGNSHHFQAAALREKKKLRATDKKGTGLIQNEDGHKIQKLEKGQNSKGIVISIPLA